MSREQDNITLNSLVFCERSRKNYFEFSDGNEAGTFSSLFSVNPIHNAKGTWSVILNGDFSQTSVEERIKRGDWNIYCPLFSAYADIHDRSNYYVILDRDSI